MERQGDLFAGGGASSADNDNGAARPLSCELRLGRWQDVLRDVERVDTLISDPPYSARTHTGHRDGVFDTNQRGFKRRDLGYTAWTEDDVKDFVGHWAPRVSGWFVALTSHDLAPVYAAALEASGRYVFAPLPYVQVGGRIRLAGDGPSSWTCWLIVARPKTRDMQRWGTLPGAYVFRSDAYLAENGRAEACAVAGGKPIGLMRALVRDYSRPGDLVVDPCAGGATTLLAARVEGRSALGAEVDDKTHAAALERIRRPFTPQLFGGAAAEVEGDEHQQEIA